MANYSIFVFFDNILITLLRFEILKVRRIDWLGAWLDVLVLLLRLLLEVLGQLVLTWLFLLLFSVVRYSLGAGGK